MAKKKQRFTGRLVEGHKGAAVEVPFDPEKLWSVPPKRLWSGRRGHTVRVKLKGVSFDSCIVPRSRKLWVLVDSSIQEKVGVSAGDMVQVSVEPFEAAK